MNSEAHESAGRLETLKEKIKQAISRGDITRDIPTVKREFQSLMIASRK